MREISHRIIRTAAPALVFSIAAQVARAVALAVALLMTAPAAHAAGLGALPAYYAGILPCADCMGMRLQLNLYAGGGYMLATTYYRDGRDETYYDLGAYALSPDSSKLALQAQDSLAFQFAIKAGGSLRKLDRDGKEITSNLPYELLREVGNAFEPRLTMRGNYGHIAGAATFVDCRSGLRFPVAPGGEANELEKVFRAESMKRDSLADPKSKAASGSDFPLVVQLQGRIASRPPAGMDGNKATLIVERFLTSFPGETCGARAVTHALESTRWVLTRVGTESVRPSAGQREAFVTFDAKTSRVVGFGGCNKFSGSYVLDSSGKLKLGAIVSTKMACMGRDFETPFLRALTEVASQRISGAHLELLDAAGVVVARFEARDL